MQIGERFSDLLCYGQGFVVDVVGVGLCDCLFFRGDSLCISMVICLRSLRWIV